MTNESVFKRLGFIILLQILVTSALAQGSSGAQSNEVKDGKAAGDEIRFEVASIHPLKEHPQMWRWGPTPTGFESAVTARELIKIAYAPERPDIALLGPGGISKLVNLPNWATDDWYELNARVPEEDMAAWQSQGRECKLLKAAFRNLLKERFQLMVHEEHTEVPVYELVVAKRGPKLTASALNSEPAHEPAKGMELPSGGVQANNPRDDGRTEWHFTYATMDDLAYFLGKIELPVENMTNLKGRYDFVMLGPDRASWDHDNPMNNWPIDHLGLELKPGKTAGVNVVVDHIEKPSEN